MDKKIIIGIIALVLVLGGAYMVTRNNDEAKVMADKKMEADKMATDDAVMKKDDPMMGQNEGTMMDKKEDQAMMKIGGQYTAYDASKLAFAKEGKVVLFFNASWCPTCQAVDKDIKASLSDIPKNVLIMTVDYDTAQELKAKYGVTMQHTFVQVDATGNSIGKWIGGDTLEALLERVQ